MTFPKSMIFHWCLVGRGHRFELSAWRIADFKLLKIADFKIDKNIKICKKLNK